jgi:C1A family cysteine protease
MKLIRRCLPIFIFITAACAGFYEDEWVNFKYTFDKKYESSKVDAKRFKIFKKNLKFINSHNENEKKTFKVEVNRYADLDETDFLVSDDLKMRWELRKITRVFSRISIFYSALGHFKDIFSSTIIVHQEVVFNESAKVPEAVDWRTRKQASEVKDQRVGHRCNSGYAFAAVGTLEAHYLIKTGQEVDLSEQEIIDCSELNLGCAGGNDEFTFNYLIENGIAVERDYEFKASKGTCPKQALPRSGVKIFGFAGVKGEENMKKALDQYGPISVRVKVPRQSFQFYKGGIFNDLSCGKVEKTSRVILIGYDHDNRTKSNFWIVKNSWSNTWGEDGYMRIEMKKNSCLDVKKGYFPLLNETASLNNKTANLSNYGIGIIAFLIIAGVSGCCCCCLCICCIKWCIDCCDS